MNIPTIIAALLITWGVCTPASAASAPHPRLRPYAGIGVLSLPTQLRLQQEEPLSLYEGPGLARVGALSPDAVQWGGLVFGKSPEALPLIVTGRKDAWLRVVFDDAGREAWVKPPAAGRYQSWEQYFKSRMVAALPGTQKKYLQLYRQPDGEVLAPLVPRQAFRVLKLDHDWALVIPPDQGALGWLRWRDEDGRLLLGVVPMEVAVLP